MSPQKLKQWLISATAGEIADLAKMAGTSRAYLYQIATGRRAPSACAAGAIVDSANVVRLQRDVLPVLTRGDLCEACKGCPHFKLQPTN